jgi:hypothetical protein
MSMKSSTKNNFTKSNSAKNKSSAKALAKR